MHCDILGGGGGGTPTYRERSLQLAGDGAEAVEHKVLAHAVDPLASGRQSAAHKVTAFPLTGAEAPHDLHAGRSRWDEATAATARGGNPRGSVCSLTWPCMFMMTTVLERLHTTKCSGFLGSRMTLLTVMSVPADVPRGLKVLLHSVVFMFHTWTREKKG